MKRLAFIGLLAALAAGTALAQTPGLTVLTATLSPSSENPPISGVGANGSATVLVHTTRDSDGDLTQAVVDFHIVFSNEANINIFAMHIHRGVRGVNGPVVIDSNFGTAIDFTPGTRSLFRQNVVTSTDGLATVESLLANPAGFYVNMHSSVNRGGVVRGQLARTDGAAISDLQSQVDDLQTSNAALAETLAKVQQNLARMARRLGVVPVE
jgi:hypothetical protein